MSDKHHDVLSMNDLYVWGKSFIHETHRIQKFPKLVSKSGLENNGIRNFRCGGECCTAILMSGEVLCWGKNYYSRLGREKFNTLLKPSTVKLPRNLRIIDVVHTERVTLFLDDEGCVWGIGANNKGFLTGEPSQGYFHIPQQITSLEKGYLPMKSIGGGLSCTDTSGRAYTFGYGYSGMLGHGNLANQLTPKRIEFFKDRDIKQISMGFNHTLFLVDDGHIYACGDGPNGGLGIPNISHTASTSLKRSLPTEIPFFRDNDLKVVYISTGFHHSACIDIHGNLYLWGNGLFGQIGNGRKSLDNYTPVIIKKIRNQAGEIIDLEERYKFLQVSCGMHHNIALMEENTDSLTRKYVLTWGIGEYGQLGIKNTQNIYTPILIDMFATKNISKVVAGGDISCVITKNLEDFDLMERVDFLKLEWEDLDLMKVPIISFFRFVAKFGRKEM